MTEDQKRDLIEFLKENLRLSVDNRVETIEIGHYAGNCYIRKVLTVHIAGEEITEVYL